jgi:hypothetical protein
VPGATAVVLRAGFDAAYICSSLNHLKFKDQPILILESGRAARKAKLKRLIKGRGLFALIDIAALVLFDRFERWKILQKLPKNLFVLEPQVDLVIDDVNDQILESFVKNRGVSKILNFGTAIYSERTLEKLDLPILNFHSGVLPKYRNVHTDLWAYLGRDFSGIGISVFSITAGIDNGPLLTVVKTAEDQGRRLWDYKYRNLSTIVELIVEILANPDEPVRLQPSSDPEEKGILWPTPTAADIARYFIYEASSSFREFHPPSF